MMSQSFCPNPAGRHLEGTGQVPRRLAGPLGGTRRQQVPRLCLAGRPLGGSRQEQIPRLGMSCGRQCQVGQTAPHRCLVGACHPHPNMARLFPHFVLAHCRICCCFCAMRVCASCHCWSPNHQMAVAGLRRLRISHPVFLKDNIQGVLNLFQARALSPIKNISDLFEKVLEMLWA